jgi:predicted nuclease of predicted toxin-antitoxin system
LKLLIDENLPIAIVQLARDHRIETYWVRDESPAAPDIDILSRLRSSGEILVTRDIRFANHVLEQIASGSPLGGVVLIREQRMADVLRAWDRWLNNPKAPRGIAVLTTRGARYREHPSS